MDPLFSLISTTCTIKITGPCSSTEKLLLPSTLLVCKSSVIICTQALITLHYMAWLFGMWKLSIIAFPLLQMSLGVETKTKASFSSGKTFGYVCILLFMHGSNNDANFIFQNACFLLWCIIVPVVWYNFSPFFCPQSHEFWAWVRVPQNIL